MGCNKSQIILRLIFFGLFALPLTGCAVGFAKVDYGNPVPTPIVSHIGPVMIDVEAPAHLTVSEANRLNPSTDIVWRGDPYGNRRHQVEDIFTAAALNATRGLSGHQRVRLFIEVERFHAITERAQLYSPVGVHRIRFKIGLTDFHTGAPLGPTQRIRADLPAYVGSKALKAERNGHSQKQRITRHLTKVLSAWLRQGPDVRTR